MFKLFHARSYAPLEIVRAETKILRNFGNLFHQITLGNSQSITYPYCVGHLFIKYCLFSKRNIGRIVGYVTEVATPKTDKKNKQDGYVIDCELPYC
jgi:hypothetical protein